MVLTVPPYFQYQNEKRVVEIVNVRKLLVGFFHFGTESQEERLKKHPVRIQNLKYKRVFAGILTTTKEFGATRPTQTNDGKTATSRNADMNMDDQ